ncbi:DNA repair protein RadA [Candidatus Dojkabacteria bacterium]|uniref:DNA repair protein RadA n=2 Tax=Candidatus Dojkabacteria TaxID=74243 RepID=A0A136KEP2_9BACT|nr:MAG: hypothetical protein UZ20_WS6002001098 [candidate division WS6 bacterium OLB21]MBW7953293.1 DNA repair protein RadA [Candidatus Dojkabacteria bacterium]
MAKKTSIYICNNCAYESGKWMGQCPNCKEYGVFSETVSLPKVMEYNQNVVVHSLADINNSQIQRIPTGLSELDRVLGGGLVEAEVVLVSGDPGIGKSTLLLQLAANLDSMGKKAVYVSAEESVGQIGLRASRVVKSQNSKLSIVSAFEVDSILNKVSADKPDLLIMDSIQTLYSQDNSSLPGSIAQIRTVASKLVTYAKETGVAVVIVGHITKQGTVAGPKLLEHLVDAVLQFEGDEKHGFRILRSLKNRFGSTNEIGIFEMTENGMHDVADPSKFFLDSDSAPRVGVCPAVVLEGNRAIVIEVQALIVNTPFSLPKRVAEGISKSKLELLAAIITKYGKVDLGTKDIYVNIAGGMRIKDTAIDLAVVLAIVSSLKNKPIKKRVVAFGEVSLTGEVRKTIRHELRQSELKRLGYTNFLKETNGSNHISALFSSI